MLSIKQCGVMLAAQLGMAMKQLIEAAEVTEGLGFGYLFRSDHLLPTDGRRGLDSPECWTSLGAIAASTHTIKFGPMVTPIGFRNPALLAKMACTLHSFSGGRLQLSIGAGWYEPEYKACGYTFPSFTTRVKQFDEALEIILPLINEGRVNFDGEYFSAHTDCYPRPDGKVHVIIGGKTKPMVKRAATKADEWNIFAAPRELYLRLKILLDEARGKRVVQISETGPFLIGRNQAELEENAGVRLARSGEAISPAELLKQLRKDGSPCGNVDEFVEQVRMKMDDGIQKFYFQTLVPEKREMIELLADTLKHRL